MPLDDQQEAFLVDNVAWETVVSVKAHYLIQISYFGVNFYMEDKFCRKNLCKHGYYVLLKCHRYTYW